MQKAVGEPHRLVQKSIAIELLEDKIKDLERRNVELLVHNNELLARARKAEGALRDHNITV